MTLAQEKEIEEQLRLLKAEPKPFYEGKHKKLYKITEKNKTLSNKVAEVFTDGKVGDIGNNNLRLAYALNFLFEVEVEGVQTHVYDACFDSGILVAECCRSIAKPDPKGRSVDVEWTLRNICKDGKDVLSENGKPDLEVHLKVDHIKGPTVDMKQLVKVHGVTERVIGECQQDSYNIMEYFTKFVEQSTLGKRLKLKVHDLTLEFGLSSFGSTVLVGGISTSSFRLSSAKGRATETFLNHAQSYQIMKQLLHNRMYEIAVGGEYEKIFGDPKQPKQNQKGEILNDQGN